jgi:hypothetical protein
MWLAKTVKGKNIYLQFLNYLHLIDSPCFFLMRVVMIQDISYKDYTRLQAFADVHMNSISGT